MKTTHLVCAAAALLLATPAMAQSGYIDLSYSDSDVDVGFDASIDGFRAGGALALDAGEFDVQLDASVANLDADGDDVTLWGVDGHLFRRFDQLLFGGTLGYRSAEGDSGDEASSWLAGLQTHLEMERATLVGAVSYSDFDGVDQAQLWGVDGEVRLFATDNIRIDGTAGWRDINFDGPGDSSDWHAGVGGEVQFSTLPVSIFGGYLHTDNEDADLTIDSLSIGVRLNWGGTLLQRDRSGATMMRPGDGLSANGL